MLKQTTTCSLRKDIAGDESPIAEEEDEDNLKKKKLTRETLM